MNLLQKRKDNADLVLKGRFIRTVLQDQSRSIDKEQVKVMSDRGFRTPQFFSRRSFDVTEEKLTATFLTVHRFVDIKTRQTKDGVIRKKNHPVYNRIIFGHLPNIVRQLAYGFSDAVIEEMKKLENSGN